MWASCEPLLVVLSFSVSQCQASDDRYQGIVREEVVIVKDLMFVCWGGGSSKNVVMVVRGGVAFQDLAWSL